MKRSPGIFARSVGVFLLVGLGPFVALGWWTYSETRARVTEFTQGLVTRLARETAVQIDAEIARQRMTVLGWSEDEEIRDRTKTWSGVPSADNLSLSAALAKRSERCGNISLALVVAHDETIVAAGRSDRSRPVDMLCGRKIDDLTKDDAERAWLREVLAPTASEGRLIARDRHSSGLIAAADDGRGLPASGAIAVGYAVPLRNPRTTLNTAPPEAALVVLFNLEPIQRTLDHVKSGFDRDRFPSGYPFLFDADADLVIAHSGKRELIGQRLVADLHQDELHAAIVANEKGALRYEYPAGTPKVAGYTRTAKEKDSGFNWAVGVGIDDTDTYAHVRLLALQLSVGGAVVTVLVIIGAWLFSRRMSAPLAKLALQTERVSRGHWDARVEPGGAEEFTRLADGFNRMAADLQETNLRLIEAEKNAAWREMARQVAHEIKNPLTPIVLSAQQIDRAHADKHPRFDAILKSSVQSIIEQAEALKRIAQEFGKFAAFPQTRRERKPLVALVARAVDLYARPRGERHTIATAFRCDEAVCISADEDELRRVFLNLFNNAFEAMPDGGTLTVSVERVGGDAAIRVTDTGRGISADDLAHLFEPYFSTRTGGTGLGLAICKKIVVEHRGSISATSVVASGTTFTITLPVLAEDAAALPPGATPPPAGTKPPPR